MNRPFAGAFGARDRRLLEITEHPTVAVDDQTSFGWTATHRAW